MSIESKVRYALYVLMASFITVITDALFYLITPQSAMELTSYSPISTLIFVFVIGPMCFYAVDKITEKSWLNISINNDKEKS